MSRSISTARRRTWGALIALVAVFITLMLPVPAQATDKPLLMGMGDSIAAGFGVSPSQAYPVVLTANTGLTPYNLAVSGAKTSDVLAIQVPQLNSLPKKPIIVTLTVGANDVGWYNLMVECIYGPTSCATEANTTAFTDSVQSAQAGIKQILAAAAKRKPVSTAVTGVYDPFGPYAYGLMDPDEVMWYKARVAQLNQAIAATAAAGGAKYVDVTSLDATAGDVFLTGNAIAHPTVQGQTKIASLVRSAIGAAAFGLAA